MEEYREDYIPMSDLGEDVSVSSDDDQTDLAREIHGHLRFLKAALPAVNNSGLTVSSTQMEGWLWTQKNESRWKKRWFVWRYSDAHEQWVLYAYKSQEVVAVLPRLGDSKPRSSSVPVGHDADDRLHSLLPPSVQPWSGGDRSIQGQVDAQNPE